MVLVEINAPELSVDSPRCVQGPDLLVRVTKVVPEYSFLSNVLGAYTHALKVVPK